MKKLSTLKQEKEKLALEVDREEEFLTNTLQKKLSKVSEMFRKT
jgi:coiled-coil domain-containing protein 6